MMRPTFTSSLLVGLLGMSAAGCAATLEQPFSTMEKASVTVFRLQNYEDPATLTPATATNAAGQTQLIPGLPAETNALLQQGAAALQQLLPGVQLPQVPGATAAAPVQQVPRFQGFRILSSSQVMDSELRANLGKLFGNASNYEAPKTNCMYPDLGFAFGPAGAATYDFVVSTQCHQVQSKNFQWPAKLQTGMTVSMEKDLAEIIRKI